MNDSLRDIAPPTAAPHTLTAAQEEVPVAAVLTLVEVPLLIPGKGRGHIMKYSIKT